MQEGFLFSFYFIILGIMFVERGIGIFIIYDKIINQKLVFDIEYFVFIFRKILIKMKIKNLIEFLI